MQITRNVLGIVLPLSVALAMFECRAEAPAISPGPVPCSVALPSPSPDHHSSANRLMIPSSHGPQVPGEITKPPKIIPLGCERPFIYRDEVYSADTPQAQDASQLKKVIQTVPEADAIMQEYQENRIKSRISAFTGTAGLLLVLFGRFVGTGWAPDLHNVMQISGETLAACGFVYSFTLLRTNEYLIPKAVETYNQAKPNDPVQIQFNMSWGF